MQVNGSQLCPNYLNHTVDLDWDAATGSTPWYSKCVTPMAFSGPTATGTGTATATVLCSGTPRCFFTAAAWIAAPGSPGAPSPDPTVAGVSFPHGLFDFELYGDTPGFTATLTLAFPQPLPAGTVYYKFGPTASNHAPHWYPLPASISGNTVIFSIADGGLGDDDLLANSAIIDQGGPASNAAVVEYYHAAFDHYFSTASADEIAKLDNGTFAGWTRTGLSFNVYPSASSGAASVCRFFSTAFAPKSSHFYTPFPAECATVKTNSDWQFEGEGDQVFYIALAAGDGTCAAGTAPVYRLFNNGAAGAPNHRYTSDASTRDQMMAKGWVLEGNGPGMAFMCAPAAR